MQRGQEISREELCTGTSTLSNQSSRKMSSEEIYYSASEELEMFAEQTGQVPRKRRREEEVGSSAEQTGQVSRKRSSEEIYYSASEELEMFAEQTGQVPRKRSRGEEVGSLAEQTGQVSIKRSREEDVGSSAEQTGQVPRKRSRGEEVGSLAEQTGQVSIKRSREEDVGSSAEQTGQAPRKRSREEEKGSSAEQTGQAPSKSSSSTTSEDLQSSSERKGEKRRSSQDTECESHLRKKRRSDEGSDGRTTECIAAPRKFVVVPTECVVAPTECIAAPTECIAAPRKFVVTPTKFAVAPTGHKETNLTLESFIFHKKLGSGAFGTVMLATHIDSGVLVAVKIVQKLQVASYGNDFALCERRALEKVGGCHYCTHTYATFQTEDHFFYVMEYMSGGDLVEMAGKCDITTLRLTAAELVCGLQFIHSVGVIHQDLKLDNVLIDSTGHIKIADFGIASVYTPERKVSPQMPFDPVIDYYWLGGTLLDLAFGAKSTLSVLDNPTNCLRPPYLVDNHPDFVDLLKKLQSKSEEQHKATINNIRDHPFFRGINWEEVEARETRPPFFVRRKSLRHITRRKIPQENLLDHKNSPDNEQVDGFTFESDQWRAIQKLN